MSYTAAASPTPQGQAVPTASRWSVPAGSDVKVSAGGFQPGSAVSVTFVAALPKLLQVVHADRHGDLEIDVTVPASAPTGWASLVLKGTAAGRPDSGEVGVQVTAARS